PVIARLGCPAWPSNVGMTDRNTPATVQARNPLSAALLNSNRAPSGTRGQVGFHRHVRTGAGSADTRCQASHNSARCTRNGSRCGAAAYSASTPAVIGPAAVPATNAVLVSTPVPRRQALVPPLINVLAAPVTAPRASPCMTRAANNQADPEASAKHIEPAAASRMLTRSTERGPTASAAGPHNHKAGVPPRGTV